MIRSIALAALAVIQTGAVQPQAREPTYVIRNVTVIATTGTPVTRVYDVVVRGRTIAQLAPAGSVEVPNATTIDGRGKFLIPGLIDSHVHIKPDDPLLLFVVNGVTTVQNMSGRPFHLDMRARVNAGTLLGPRIVTTGPTTAEVGVSTPEEVEALVREQKALGYDVTVRTMDEEKAWKTVGAGSQAYPPGVALRTQYALLGVMVMASANSFITLYLGLELLSIPAYLLAGWRKTDLKGNDVTETLRDFDRDTVDTFRRLPHWIGYAEEHGLTVGSTIDVQFPDGSSQAFRLKGIFDPPEGGSPFGTITSLSIVCIPFRLWTRALKVYVPGGVARASNFPLLSTFTAI